MGEGLLSSISSYAAVVLLLLLLAPLILIGYGWITFMNTSFLAVAFIFQFSSPLVIARLIYRWRLPEDSADYTRSAMDAVFDEWLGSSGFFLFFAFAFGFACWNFYNFVRIEGMPTSPFIVVLEKGVINGWLVTLAIIGFVWDVATQKR